MEMKSNDGSRILMASKYTYNTETLRYERMRLSFLNVLLYVLGLFCFGTLFFVGLVFLQNRIIETPTEKKLRAENKALRKYKIELASQLQSSRQTLTELRAKDKALYERIFSEKVSFTEGNSKAPSKSNKEILLADAFAFKSLTTHLQTKYAELNTIAKTRSAHFSGRASVRKEDISRLTTVPSYAPVAEFDASKLVSGFGIRINPFHKGKYHHDGIDLASPRGSQVLAAAAGRVTLFKKSDLQAGFGNYIEVDHGHGYVTRYANLGDITVKLGQKVTKGQSIGIIGISGGSVAPHVHYEVLRGGKNLDPAQYLVHGLNSADYSDVMVASKKQNQSLD